MSDDFVEVETELPYLKIICIDVSSVTFKQKSYSIECSVRCVGGDPDQAQRHEIVRSQDDVQWLLEQIRNSKQCCLIPAVSAGSFVEEFYKKIAEQSGSKAKAEHKIKERLVLRCLRLVTELMLDHLRAISEELLHPIFIFFHSRFELYKNPIYYKQQASSFTEKTSTFLWDKYKQITGQVTNWGEIQSRKESIDKEANKMKAIKTGLSQYVSALYKLKDDILGQKNTIQQRLTQTESLLFTIQGQESYLTAIVYEISDTLAHIDRKERVEDLMRGYSKHLEEEYNMSKDFGIRMWKEYREVMCHKAKTIQIAPK